MRDRTEGIYITGYKQGSHVGEIAGNNNNLKMKRCNQVATPWVSNSQMQGWCVQLRLHDLKQLWTLILVYRARRVRLDDLHNQRVSDIGENSIRLSSHRGSMRSNFRDNRARTTESPRGEGGVTSTRAIFQMRPTRGVA